MADTSDIIEREGSRTAARAPDPQPQRLGDGWQRIEIRLADHPSPERYETHDHIHLFELDLDSRRASEFEMLTSGAGRTDAQWSHISTPQHPSPLVQSSGGNRRYRVQQILIDDSVFREAAAAVAPSDPYSPTRVKFSGPIDPSLKMLADALLDEACNPTPGSDLYADTLAQQIAIRILRQQYCPQDPGPSNRKELSSSDLDRLSAYLNTDLCVRGGVDQLAAVLGMDAFAFSRAFKETTGKTPHQYLIDCRIHRVKDLLLEHRLGLAEIAYETGFSSQSHMTSTFKKRVGVSPGRWRRDRKRP